jgi:hypothetical protein
MRVLFVAMMVSSMWMASTTRSMRIPPTVHTRIALHGTGPDVRLLRGEPLSIVWRLRHDVWPPRNRPHAETLPSLI